ncbi:glycerate kinase [Evansella cellulosilytica]|uniref:Glycerate kinase n=1 Tax=Evansella cellulosilytica (strain ATCC 21833 / DSM 2522 / FERM P-1141 / JCM 9156 / N-4) TaxID=649639 RepID=E6TTH9_EVAC2|nr:glycerate kinase [Evansella cellulosilytica]ADU29615.1 glycerate kinase [Evansella cellulosilytica DSM 2522]
MKFVIAPDSFKGSISAQSLCEKIEAGIKNVIPHADVVKVPLADGGEGTIENMVYATNGRLVSTKVYHPLFKRVRASYGILGDNKTVVIDVSQASGLTLLSDEEKNPLQASSFGTGQLIKHALNNGYRRFLIGLGGSATNDAGVGLLKALGMKFLGENNKEIADGGGNLSKLIDIDDSTFDNRIQESTFLVACDVKNTLCGNEGASAIFGPQKGATPEMVTHLDASLHHFATIVLKKKGIDLLTIEGGGAAGGIGAALVAFCQASLKSGINVVMKEVNFPDKIQDADYIFTGEGKLDKQTLSGKVIMGVSKEAKTLGVPVIALCGSLELNNEELKELGVLSAFSIMKEPCDLKTAVHHTEEWVLDVAERVTKLLI